MNPLRPRAATGAVRTAVQRRRLPTFETRPLRGARAALPWWSNPGLPALRHLPGRSVDGSARPKSARCQRANPGNNTVTSRQRGRSARRTRRVDRPSTRDTLSARRTTERVDSRQTRLDGVVPGGGGNERRPRNAFRAKQASGSDRLGNVTTRPTDVLAYPEAVGVASPPGGRKREGPSPAWAETAPAGSGRRRRLGPGPARDAPSPGNRHRRKGRPMPGIVDGRAGTQDGRIALVAECRILGAGGRAPDAGQGDAVRGAGGVSDQGGQPVGGVCAAATMRTCCAV